MSMMPSCSRRLVLRAIEAAIVGCVLLAPSTAQSQVNTYSKTETIEYHDDASLWVMGQVRKTTNVNTGLALGETVFDTATAMPLQSYTFGKLQHTLTYNADGTLATVKDGNNNLTTLSNWYRGVPRSIKYADNSTQSAVVNSSGWITQITDENGFATNYTYDAMGRLASVVYPMDDSTAWNTETFTFTPVQSDEHGLPPGHWTMRRRLGNRHVNTYYDALWRPVLEESLDVADIGGTLSQIVNRYDESGRLMFQSYPQRGIGNYWDTVLGTWTEYDALDRVTSVSQDSEHGLLATLTEYLPGHQMRVTNPRGQQTITSFMAYDQPRYDWPRTIVHPEGTYTDITRDIFGKPTALIRRNASGSESLTRHYVYAWDQTLCKSIEPETGATVYYNDAAGNLWWSAGGLNLPSITDCNFAEAQVSGRMTTRTYDARNRMRELLFPDGRGNQVWTYTADGLPRQIETYNNAGGDKVINLYDYNRRRMLTAESITQPGWYTWGIGYGYDANGSLALHTYPTGLVIGYSPNALGQPSRVHDQFGSTYASGLSYYPNGAIKQFTYGNGLMHSMAQNTRQLPGRVTDGGGALDYDYGYDANGNISHIYDYIPDLTPGSTPKHRWMTYDGLDRLTATGSAIFGGDHWHRFTYDALDNIKSWKLGGVKDYANYYYEPGTNRLTNIMNSAGSSIVGLGYDVQGNLANKNGAQYEFDYGNRLRQVVGGEFYRYDGHGRRVLNARPAAITVSQYSNAGQLMYQEETGKGNFEHIYLAGSLLATRNSGVVKYQHTDALGSPVAVTNAAGQVIERNDYEPYGAVIGQPNYSGIGFTGHVQDAATGLTYMQERYYDSQVGLFLSVDPVTADGNTGALFNRYMYAANNPYRYFDPDGACTGSRIENGDGTCKSTGDFTTQGFGPTMPGAQTVLHQASIEAQAGVSGAGGAANLYAGNDKVREPLYCSGGADCDFMYNQNEFLGGSISADEFHDRTVTQGKGGMIGAAAGLSLYGGAAFWGSALRMDLVRFGSTVIPNQAIYGTGTPGASVAWAIKGGGGRFPFHYHVHRYNWYKPWVWTKRTPIIKPQK